MINYEQLRAAIDRKLGTDPEFRTIMKRITEGRANFIDTARYSQVIAHTLGNELSKAVLELSDREAVTKQLLHDSYSDINDVFGRVQSAMDQKKGISLRQQIAPFPEERVDKFSHALVDPTVEDSVIKRRARAGSETITKSFHDDCIEVNAEFREEAGLKCYIERIGTDCCQWCTDVAGKYEMKDQPQGIFRRHDNCDCTIIYDGQVLRGQAGDNGRRSKKWAEVPKDAGAAEPVRLNKEQAQKLEQGKLKTYKQSIDNSNKSVIIKEKTGETAEIDVHELGKIDIEKFKFIANGKILTDEVIITDNRIEHIIERRGKQFYNDFYKYFPEIIENPDYIFKDDDSINTAIVSKTYSHKGKTVNLALRLVVEGDNPNYKNSVLTAIGEGKKRFAQRLRNHPPVYKRVDKSE